MTEQDKAATKKAIIGHQTLRLAAAPTLDIDCVHELTDLTTFDDRTGRRRKRRKRRWQKRNNWMSQLTQEL